MSKTERNAVVLLVPFTVFYTVALRFALSGPRHVLTFSLQLYGFIIYSLCGFVVYKEYTDFFDVHKQKDLALDTLSLLASALGMLYFIANVEDLTNALWGILIFLLGACWWEFYTMRVNKYFDVANEPWTYWFRLLAEPRFPFRAPVETLHRDEYRYWLIVDGSQVVILTYLLVFQRSLISNLSDLAILILIIVFVVLQLVSVFRYLVVVRRWRRRETGLVGLARGSPTAGSISDNLP